MYIDERKVLRKQYRNILSEHSAIHFNRFFHMQRSNTFINLQYVKIIRQIPIVVPFKSIERSRIIQIDWSYLMSKEMNRQRRKKSHIWSINVPSHHVFRIIIHKGITNNRLYITSGRFIITGIQSYMWKTENVSAKTHQGFSKPNDKNYLLSLHNPEEVSGLRQFFMHKWLFFLFSLYYTSHITFELDQRLTKAWQNDTGKAHNHMKSVLKKWLVQTIQMGKTNGKIYIKKEEREWTTSTNDYY